MAGRLTRHGGAGPVALALLTAGVLAAHLWLLDGARLWEAANGPVPPEPERLQAAFVRELKQAAPPAPAPEKAPEKPGAPPPDHRLPATVGTDLAPLRPDEAASQPRPELEKLAALPPTLAVSAPVGDWMPGLEWPLSTQLDYSLTGDFRGPVYGSAQVQWLREGSHYQVHLEAKIGPAIAPLVTRRLSSDGQITAQGLKPRRFDEVTGGLAGGRRQTTLRFDDGGVFLADGRREPIADDGQDAASQFVQLTWLFLTGRRTAQFGEQVELPLALPRNVHLWRYKVGELENVDTPMGPIPAWHLDSAMDDTRGDMQTELWLAPTLQYLPVRIRIWQNRGVSTTQIDLRLSRPPLQAQAPGASAPAASAPL